MEPAINGTIAATAAIEKDGGGNRDEWQDCPS
jgi:hypothetical protein